MKVQNLLKNAALAVSASLLWGCSSTSPTAFTSVPDQSSGVSLETANSLGDSITVFGVTSAGDSPDADGEDGICVSVDGGCTLRAAIEQANRSGASRGNTVFIGFDPGLIGEPLLLSERLPEITADVVIAGPGADQLTISGNHQVELFRIGAEATVEIRGLTLADGTGPGSGIGILNQGVLTVTDSILQGHTAGDDGAGIASSGTLTLNGTQILNNVASDDGGGISISGGRVTLNQTTVAGNTAIDGGGISIFGGELRISRSTIRENQGTDVGGGISTVFGNVRISRTAITENEAGLWGGGIFNFGDVVLQSGNQIRMNAAAVGGGIANLAVCLNSPVSPLAAELTGSTFAVRQNTPNNIRTIRLSLDLSDPFCTASLRSSGDLAALSREDRKHLEAWLTQKKLVARQTLN